MILFCTTWVGAQEKLVFSMIPGTPLSEIGRLTLTEAYQKIGIMVSFAELPGERALYMSNWGDVDGETMRIAGIEKKYTNLLKIPVSYVSFQGVVFTKKLDFNVEGWKSLKPYQIGILRGSKFAENGTKGMKRNILSNLIQLGKMLKIGRIDLFVESRLNGLKLLQQAKVYNYKILEPPLIQLPLYHYLHKKHKKLVPKIRTSLKTMQTKGRFQKIYKQVKLSLISNK